jgi:hypothetical protein
MTSNLVCDPHRWNLLSAERTVCQNTNGLSMVWRRWKCREKTNRKGLQLMTSFPLGDATQRLRWFNVDESETVLELWKCQWYVAAFAYEQQNWIWIDWWHHFRWGTLLTPPINCVMNNATINTVIWKVIGAPRVFHGIFLFHKIGHSRLEWLGAK